MISKEIQVKQEKWVRDKYGIVVWEIEDYKNVDPTTLPIYIPFSNISVYYNDKGEGTGTNNDKTNR